MNNRVRAGILMALIDLEMFDLVGYAVAMGDAQPALIERADFVTGTIEERGIQSVLEQFHIAS